MIHDPACPDLTTHARRTFDERPFGSLEAHCIEAEREWEQEQAAEEQARAAVAAMFLGYVVVAEA